MSETKRCSGCKEQKPIEEFGRNTTRLDGRGHYCANCRREHDSLRRRRIAAANNQRRYVERNRNKQNARLLVRTLLKNGKLKREPCFLCGTDPVEGHHIDYDYPDKVLWLCVKHHKDIHYAA